MRQAKQNRHAARRRPVDQTLDVHDAADGSRRLKGSMGSGFRWIGSFRIAGQVVQVVSLLILTQLLDPRQFGLVAIANIVIQFFDRVLGDTGTSAAIVRHKTITQGLVSTVLFLNQTVGLLSFLFLAATGGFVADKLGDAEAGNLLRVLGLMAFLNSAMYVQVSLLRRMQQFKKLAVVNFTNIAMTSVATVVLAAIGLNEWALVAGTLLGSGTAVLLAWTLSEWRPTLCFLPSRLKEISNFSGALTAQYLFGYFAFTGDRIVVSRMFGATALGYYGMANRIVRYPVDSAVQTYREVVMPNLARLQDDNAVMVMAYRRSVAGMTYLLLPLCFVLAAVADPFVGTVLGASWEPTSDVLAIMAVLSGIRSITVSAGSIYLAKGRADLSLKWTLFSSVVLMAAYLIGSYWDLNGVAIAYLIAMVLLSYPGLWIPLRLIDAKPWDVLRSVWETVLAAGLAAGAALLIRLVTDNDVIRLVAGIAVAVVVYLGYSLIRKPSGYRDSMSLLSDLRPKRTQQPEARV